MKTTIITCGSGDSLTIGWGFLAVAAGLLAGRINPSVYMQGVKAGSLFLGPCWAFSCWEC